jgi:hypothetical protein
VLGNITEDTLEAEGLRGGAEDPMRRGRECEMRFYIGLARLHAGDKSTALVKSALAASRALPNTPSRTASIILDGT